MATLLSVKNNPKLYKFTTIGRFFWGGRGEDQTSHFGSLGGGAVLNAPSPGFAIGLVAGYFVILLNANYHSFLDKIIIKSV